jgi:polysaccharide biosynthesis transport protein
MDIWRAAEVLNRRKWLILFSVVITTLLTFGASRLTGSRYIATVRFVAPETSPLTTSGAPGQNEGAARMTPEERSMLQAMYAGMILSQDVIVPAFEKLNEPFIPDPDFLKDIEFEGTGLRLYELRVSNPNPERAGKIANALAESFVERNHRIRTHENERVVKLLTEQLKDTEARLEKARGRYRTYSREHRVLGNPEQEFQVVSGEIQAARVRLDQAIQDKAMAEARLTAVQQKMTLLDTALRAPRPVLVGPRSQTIAADLDRAESRLTQLKTRYDDNWPEVQEATKARDELRATLANAQRAEALQSSYDEKATARVALVGEAATLKTRISELNAQIATVSSTVSAAEGRIQRARELGDPLSSLASEVQTLSEARANLVARLHSAETTLDVARQQNPIVIMAKVDRMNPPINATGGRTRKLVIMGALCALLGSCALIIALDSIDRRLRTVHEAEQVLPARVLAAIPQPENPIGYAALARVSELYPQSLQAEAYRFLGLHLLSTAGPQVRSLMALSAKAEQGSTTTVTNLAITLAQAGHSVVLVDANTRTPELHHVFKTDNEFGFTDLLLDPTARSFEKALLPTSVPGLRVVTSGTTPDNRWELFRSENLLAVSRRLREIADYVLYDTPSGVVFTDALNLAPVVDGAFLCVRALETPTGAEQRLIELVDQANVKVLGAVLSHVPTSMVAGYENYQHYYAPAMRALSPGSTTALEAEATATEEAPRIMEGVGMMETPRSGGRRGGGKSGTDYDQDVRKEM